MKILHHLLSIYQPDEGKLPHGTYTKVANKFGIGRMAVKNIWDRREDFNFKKRRSNSGRKAKRTDEQILSAVRQVPLSQRTTLRKLAEATGIPKTTLQRKMKEGLLEVRTSCIKPKSNLSEKHNLDRTNSVIEGEECATL